MTAPLTAAEPLVRWDWVRDHTDDITAALWEHLHLTAVSVAVGFAISLVLALVAVRWRWTYEPLAGVCSVLYAIPSLALFGVLVAIPFFGLGFRTAMVALVSYTLLILLRNTSPGSTAYRPPPRGRRRHGLSAGAGAGVDLPGRAGHRGRPADPRR